MNRFDPSITSFEAATSRSRDMIRVYDALKLTGAADLTCDDALRAAWIQSVSSFDFFVHEVVAIEAYFRAANKVATRNIHLPMDVFILNDAEAQLTAINTHFRRSNSYRAFVAPDKIGEVLSCFTSKPWEKIAAQYSEITSVPTTDATLKETIGKIWDRRNKIAHEADINPTLSGVDLWPMYKVDVEYTLDFIVVLGKCIPPTVAASL